MLKSCVTEAHLAECECMKLPLVLYISVCPFIPDSVGKIKGPCRSGCRIRAYRGNGTEIRSRDLSKVNGPQQRLQAKQNTGFDRKTY